MKMKRIAIAWSIILGISLVLTMLGAWLAPGWLGEPGGLLAIFAGSFAAVSALFGGKMTEWADVFYGKREGSKNVAMDQGQIAAGANSRNIQTQTYIEKAEIKQDASPLHPASTSPAARGLHGP